jgi:hypothetical protein
MRTIRSMLAATAAAVAVLAATTGVAAAGQASVIDTIDYECDTSTGNFVVTLTLESDVDIDGEIEANYGVFEGPDQTDSGALTFVPNPIPALGSSTATLEVPGTTTFVGVDWFVDFGEGGVEGGASVDIAETCEAVPTTPTSAETTSTTAAAPAAQVQPRFTG